MQMAHTEVIAQYLQESRHSRSSDSGQGSAPNSMMQRLIPWSYLGINPFPALLLLTVFSGPTWLRYLQVRDIQQIGRELIHQ